MRNKKIFVTQPSLPPLEELMPYLEKIWESKWVTNNGQFHQEFEKSLCKYLGVKYISIFTNGTLALITALQSLDISGEVITTPFSFVATTHALHWNKIKPVFCDIDPVTMNIDPDKIETLITPETSAILPVHVYGNPCNVGKIGKIAKKHNLKVIYDAAHAFGVTIKGNSINNYGDLSVLSFHATKVFNTFEGGAIISHDEKTKIHIDHLKNFGFHGELNVVAPGINSKMNEFQAALGLIQLKYIDKEIEKCKKITEIYKKELQKINGIAMMDEIQDVRYNYSYFPVLIDKEKFGLSRDALYEKLKNNNIFTRRYFYPLISHFAPYNKELSANPKNLPVAEEIAKNILCLPIYPDLDKNNAIKIINLING